MATLYMDIKCPNLEKKIKEGCTLCITRNGPHSMLSRLETANGNLLVSVSYYSLKKILSETEFQLTDKLGFHMPNFNSSEKYAISLFPRSSAKLVFNSIGLILYLAIPEIYPVTSAAVFVSILTTAA